MRTVSCPRFALTPCSFSERNIAWNAAPSREDVNRRNNSASDAPASRRLRKAFRTIDEFLEGLICEARERAPVGQRGRRSLMECLLAATSPSGDSAPLTDREVRDDLLATGEIFNDRDAAFACFAAHTGTT